MPTYKSRLVLTYTFGLFLVFALVLFSFYLASKQEGFFANDGCSMIVAKSFTQGSTPTPSQTRKGLTIKDASEPLVYGGFNELTLVIATLPRYNAPHAVQMEGTTNNSLGNWVILPDNNVHIRKSYEHTFDFSLFEFELRKSNPKRTTPDLSIICMGDEFSIMAADLPGYYVCLGEKGGDMFITNDGRKSVFRFRNKYTDARTHPDQNDPIDAANVELMYLSAEETGNGRRVEFLKGKTKIGTGLASSSQHVYIHLHALT